MKQIITKFILFVAVAFFVTACSPRQLSKSYDKSKTNRIYSEAVGDAAKAQVWEVEKNLVEVKKENSDLVWKEMNGKTYLLVSSWKEDTTYYKNNKETGTYNTGNYPIWVTTASELQNLCQTASFGRAEGLDLRLKQLLGLPPTVDKKYFVEAWVLPEDMFRPCLDNKVAESNCNLSFPDETTKEYKEWVDQLRLASYFHAEWNKNYPWTQLGYTYDWNPKNKNHVGLSEFVIDKNKEIIINRFYTTMEYCKIVAKK